MLNAAYVGKYYLPAVKCEAMYETTIHANNKGRWVEVVRKMAEMGVGHVAECGPGKVLAGLTKRIDGNLQCVALADSASMRTLIEGAQA